MNEPSENVIRLVWLAIWVGAYAFAVFIAIIIVCVGLSAVIVHVPPTPAATSCQCGDACPCKRGAERE